MGLMQIMPATWAKIRQQLDLGTDPYDPRDNIIAGAAILRDLYKRYGSPGFIAAYHAGNQRFDDFVLNGRQLPAKTLAYIARVRRALASEDNPAAPSEPSGTSEFDVPFARVDRRDHASAQPDPPSTASPFVHLQRASRRANRRHGEQAHVQQP